VKKMLILGMVLAAFAAAYAYPTLTGPTGLATIPTAAVAAAGQLQVAADYYDAEGDSAIPIRALYGIGENFEVGLGYWMQDDNDGFMLNAKYLTPLTFGDMAWAAGAQYIDLDAMDTILQAYFVGTKQFSEAGEGTPGFSGSIGFNWTDVDAADDSAFRFFVGGELAFANNLTVNAEFQTKDDDIEADSLWSIGVRYPFTEALTGQLGYTNGPIVGFDDSNFFLGLNYGFGLGAE